MNPQDSPASGSGSDALLELKRHEAALESCDKAIALNPDDAEAYKNRGNALLALNRHDAAIQSYERAILIKPDYADAYFNRGNVLSLIEQHDAAIQSFDRAIALDPGDAQAYNNRGIALQALKQHDAAMQSFEQAIALNPGYADAVNNRSLVLQELKRYDEALASYDQALALKSGQQSVTIAQVIQLGLNHHQSGRLPEAERCYQRALQFDPNNFDAVHLLGVIANQVGKNEIAVQLISRALSIRPDHVEALSNRGNALQELKRYDEALASYDQALALKPDYADALSNRGNTLQKLQRYGEALASYDQALALKPGFAEASYNRGIALYKLKRYDEALASYDQAVLIKPDYAEALNTRGYALHELGQRDGAVTSYRQALALNPDSAEARWALTMCQLPIIAASESDSKDSRIAFVQALSKLDDWFGPDQIEKGSNAVGCLQPFYLAYQAENNRSLLLRYGALCHRLMHHWQASQGFELRPSTDKSGSGHVLRIGIISGHIFDHSVWNALVRGWVQHLDHGRFELHIFHLGTIQDQETSFAKSAATRFIQGERSLQQWVESVLEQPLDILVYPEIGIDPMTVKLASMRLAPVQAAAWGHPETTGLPTIDYFVSANDLEPDDAQDCYTERLVKLPHLGCCYPTPPLIEDSVDLARLGINPESASLLVCPGTPFKYAPEHDWVLPAIAKELPNCQFVFFTHRVNSLSELLQRRLAQSFARTGLAYEDYIVFVPWQKKPAFYGLMRRAHIYLDTIGFSGFNTAMQAVECALPIVTCEGRFLRGRLASGILNRMGLSELVATSEMDYIGKVVRICLDADYRELIRRRIVERRHILFDDIEPVRALEEFLIRVSN